MQVCADRDTDYLNKYKIGQELNDNLPELMENMAIPAKIDVPNEENWDEVSSILLKTECEDPLVKMNEFSSSDPDQNSINNFFKINHES